MTGCTLAFQVVFTRLLSSVLAYHFSFLAISLALLGTGAGSLLIYLRPDWFDRRPLGVMMAWFSAAFAALLVLSPLVLVRLDYEIGEDVDLTFALNLSVACILAAAISLASGGVVALAIRGYADNVGRVYTWDLVGAGIGALVVVPLLFSPAPELLVWLGLVAVVATVLFTDDNWTRRFGGAVTVTAVAVLVMSNLTSLLYLPMVDGVARDDLVADEWHPLSRVQAKPLPGLAYSLLFYDRVFAHVPNVTGADLPNWRDLGLGPASVGYELTGPGHALVIGGGGGRDIYNALSSGQQVDVIELNSAIRDAVDDALGDHSASPYSRPGVSTTIGDGRSVLAARDTRYDQIHLGFTDTLTTNAAQGFALSEANLYTVEAFDEYFEHLQPRGILNLTRPERLVGDEALRMTVLTMAALERQGVDEPERHMVVLRGTDSVGLITAPYETVLARLEPFSDKELARIRRLADRRGDGVAFISGGPNYGPWADLAAAQSWGDFCSGYHLDVCPPTDDQPFFFNMRRIGDVLNGQQGYHYGVDPYQLLVVTLVILVVLSLVGLLLPLRLARSNERPTVSSLLYFAAVGMGFLLLEIVLIQRFVLFLGFPTYALSVVLFALLIFTGVGAAITSRLPRTRATTVTVLGAVALLVMVVALALQPLLRSLIGVQFPLRVILSIAFLAPVGIGLGMPMPLGLSRFAALYPRSVAYAWGVNGMASVLASVLGIVIAINSGYVVATLVAAGCYAVAGAHAAIGRWTAEAAPSPHPTASEADAYV